MMIKRRFAVIDLGTNTFHLLVVDIRNNKFTEVLRKRTVVKLAEESIDEIGPQAFQRGISALKEYKQILLKLYVKRYKVFGTAALRSAKNGSEFVEQALIQTGIPIEVIDGNREAELIYKGVGLSIPMKDNIPYLIMDIGGGSVEFIICNAEKMIWAQSFPIGVAVLFHKFHKSDPISENDLNKLRAFLKSTLQPVIEQLKKYPIKSLIGASGTFDVLEIALDGKKQKNGLHSKVPIDNFDYHYNLIIKTNLAERIAMEYIPDTRAELIVGAMILIKFVLEISGVKEILTSKFALKEGVIVEHVLENWV